jgi:hypothetical protein
MHVKTWVYFLWQCVKMGIGNYPAISLLRELWLSQNSTIMHLCNVLLVRATSFDSMAYFGDNAPETKSG